MNKCAALPEATTKHHAPMQSKQVMGVATKNNKIGNKPKLTAALSSI